MSQENATIGEIIKKQREFFNSDTTKSLKFRKTQLKVLKRAIVENEHRFFEALKKDLNKQEFEAYGSELAQVIDEIRFALKNIDEWAKPKRVPAALVSFPSKHAIYPQPYGLCYISGAWNYPVLLSLSPVVGAIAAGNCVLLKPSELAFHTARLLCDIIAENFEGHFFSCVFGGPETSEKILSHNLDYIFFTGSPRVGKIIMKAAAEKLTPVTLELGGKSPCIVDEDANLKTSAKRVAFGKLLNGGQTCIAPDFLVVHEKIKDEFLELLKDFIISRYGPVQGNTELCRTINEGHFQRLTGYLKEGKIYHGGSTKKQDLYIEPTILTDVSWNDLVMKEEIFGPILPVITFTDFEATLNLLNTKEKPLAAYYFGTNKRKQKYFVEKLQFGGGGINDTVFHFGNPELPVGGIGNSGIGRYHGKHTFNTFSHLKSIVYKPYFPDPDIRYPPYGKKLKWLRMIFKF